MSLCVQIPPLGKHYSQRWAQEDLLEEQKEGARAAAAAEKKKGVLGALTELDSKGELDFTVQFTSLQVVCFFIIKLAD